MVNDAIIVLAGGISKTRELSKNSQERVKKGVELFKQKKAPILIMSGTRNEAQAMRDYTQTLGIPGKNILLEEKSRDTIGNAYFTKVQYLKPRNFKKFIIVTSDYHIPRVQYIFRKVLGSKFEINFEGVVSNISPENKSFNNANEKISLLMTKFWVWNIKDGDDEKILEKLYQLPEYGGKSKIMSSHLYVSRIINWILTAFIKLRRKLLLQIKQFMDH